MAKPLDELRALLARAQRLARESSYERALPVGEGRAELFEAQTGLREYTNEHPDDEAAWRLRALAEECVTNFKAAITCLEHAMALSGTRIKKDLKTLARLQEYARRQS